MIAPRASVVVASHDHSPDLVTWFRALARQSAAPADYEVILANPGYPVDHGAALEAVRREAPDGPRMEARKIASRGRAAALNEALRSSRGSVIIFLGDDFIAGRTLVEAHLEYHERHPEPEAAGIGLGFLSPEHRSPFGVWLEESGKLFGIPFRPDVTEVPEHYFYAGNSSVKRALLDRAGPLDERFTGHAWDDFELGQRLIREGMHSRLVPGARAEHAHAFELAEREAMMREAGGAARVFESLYPGTGVVPKTARWPAWRHLLRVTRAHLDLALSPRDAALTWWWRARLDAAFAAGYRRGA